jgi:hypothetical protein
VTKKRAFYLDAEGLGFFVGREAEPGVAAAAAAAFGLAGVTAPCLRLFDEAEAGAEAGAAAAAAAGEDAADAAGAAADSEFSCLTRTGATGPRLTVSLGCATGARIFAGTSAEAEAAATAAEDGCAACASEARLSSSDQTSSSSPSATKTKHKQRPINACDA